MDKTTAQIFALLPSSQQKELIERASVGLQEKLRVIVSNLSVDKLIVAHEYLTKLANGESESENEKDKEPVKHRPPPSYVSTPDDSDVDYTDMPPLIKEKPTVVKNIHNYGPGPFVNTIDYGSREEMMEKYFRELGTPLRNSDIGKPFPRPPPAVNTKNYNYGYTKK